MSDTLDLLDGIAALIVANVPGTAYNPDAVYTAGQVGIFDMLMPASPDECIVLTVVPQSDDPSQPMGQALIQVRARGAANRPRRPLEILDPIARIMLGGIGIPCGSAFIDQVTSRVRVPMGMDDSKRWDWSDNYTADVSWTPTLNRPAGGFW